MDNQSPPPDLMQAILALWQLEPLARESLFAAPAFVRLREICQKLYCDEDCSKQGLKFPLQNALLSLGLPAILIPSTAHLARPPDVAAVRLDAAFRQRESRRLHLCPLDCADDIPVLNFGPNSVRTMSAAELRVLVDAERMLRFNSKWAFDAERFSNFHWLVIHQTVPVDANPGSRFGSKFSFDFNEDLGAIKPHPERFPTTVEDALFALLLLPWDRWLQFPNLNSYGFGIPWVYTITDDIFRWPSEPPSPDTLSWEPAFSIDRDGEEVEYERPFTYPMDEWNSDADEQLNDADWADLMRARQSVLFETPITHFLVRAFLSDGIDEFLAHILVIEAALGLPIDAKRRPKLPDNPGATERVAARLSVLLGSVPSGEDFKKLFELRNQFVHGRPMSPIAGADRLLARRLARQTVGALVNVALESPAPKCRDIYLDTILSKGWNSN